ncbi:hypothetical protein HY639_00510 [Candidatus Woesearchaeota archaeon]|nr:hypothetical protein [Candidatus Woesearchaeota archaeon]
MKNNKRQALFTFAMTINLLLEAPIADTMSFIADHGFTIRQEPVATYAELKERQWVDMGFYHLIGPVSQYAALQDAAAERGYRIWRKAPWFMPSRK